MNLQNGISLGLVFFIIVFLFFINPSNKWHYILMADLKLRHKITIVFTLLVTIAFSILPMSISPYWNGTLQLFADKQQYDRMGDSLLQGHLYIDNGDIDPALKAMKNPYDQVERERLGVKVHWDEAFYNNHYYMYFGVVPTIILFIPYKLLTGTALLSYQATQIYTVLTIIGLFFLFYIFCRSYYPTFPFSLYLILSSAFSVMSIGYSIAAPALYCTAIVSGICMMVWCIIFLLKGAWLEKNSLKSNQYLFFGSLLGALAFGCRPPVALANIIVLTVIFQILLNNLLHKNDKIKKIVLLLVPYFVVGVLLMLYNYARFNNVFEFGQSYQLTVADQHYYGSFIERFNINHLLIGLWLNMYAPCGFSDSFPYLRFNGFFINYPILLFSSNIFSKSISPKLKKRNLFWFSVFAFLISFVIILFDVYWSPFLLKRYHLDFQYLLCIVTFLSISTYLETISQKNRRLMIPGIIFLAFLVLVAEFLFFCIPFDGNYTELYPEALDIIYRGLRFGL